MVIVEKAPPMAGWNNDASKSVTFEGGAFRGGGGPVVLVQAFRTCSVQTSTSPIHGFILPLGDRCRAVLCWPALDSGTPDFGAQGRQLGTSPSARSQRVCRKAQDNPFDGDRPRILDMLNRHRDRGGKTCHHDSSAFRILTSLGRSDKKPATICSGRTPWRRQDTPPGGSSH